MQREEARTSSLASEVSMTSNSPERAFTSQIYILPPPKGGNYR
jgi:hypothetical protein